jgi:hypothetical protein
MKVAIRTLLVLVLVFLGWRLGRAQTSTPDFVLRVETAGGHTKVTCEHGCALRWFNGPTTLEPKADFDFGCTENTCKATIHGFIRH